MINEILKNIQIENLNEMQNAALKATSKQVMIFSPTGSGKTVAFLLPLIQRLRKDINGVQAVIIAPSRELALQIDSVIKSMRTPFTSVAVYGGRAAMDEHRTIKSLNPTIIIGTPGLETDIHMRIESGYQGQITLENVSLSNVKERPCLEIGDNCIVSLVLKGENRLRDGGILVPPSSRLTVEGPGSLQINVYHSGYYGIGNGMDETAVYR